MDTGLHARAGTARSHPRATIAKRLDDPGDILAFELVWSTSLREGDHVICARGDVIPADGAVVEGIAIVDERPIGSDAATTVRSPRPDRSTVVGGARVLSDYLVVRIATSGAHPVTAPPAATAPGGRAAPSPPRRPRSSPRP